MRYSFAIPFLMVACTLALADDNGKTNRDSSQFPGPTAEGFLLPNGWRLSPVGKHVPTTDLPLNIVPLKDSRRALIASSGYNSHDLALVDLADEPKAISKAPARQSWFGLVQNGPDHVDAHRTVGLVVSPYTKRKFVDSTQYATVSMVRSVELILGLAPLSQYDAAAHPMFNSFTNAPDPTPYSHLPVMIDLNAKNDRLAYGADRSAKMDFSEYDKIDDFELNEILWHAVMRADAPEPPAVRRAIAFRSQSKK